MSGLAFSASSPFLSRVAKAAFAPFAANATRQRGRLHVGVCRVIDMTIWAMGLGQVFFPGFAAAHVFAVRDRLKMLRVDAHRVTAEVIKFEVCGDKTYESFVDEAMYGNLVAAIDPLECVPFRRLPQPHPAPIIPARIEVDLSEHVCRDALKYHNQMVSSRSDAGLEKTVEVGA